MVIDKNPESQGQNRLAPDQISYAMEFLASTVGMSYDALIKDESINLSIKDNILKAQGKNSSLDLTELFDCLILRQEDSPPRDRHDRVMSSHLADYDQAVDRHVLNFRKMLEPGIKTAPKTRLLLTHDVDRIHFRELYFPGHTISSLFRNPAYLWNLRHLFDSDRKIMNSFGRILEAEAIHNAQSIFYLMCEPYRLRRHNARYSYRYRLYPRIASLIKDSGSEIGLHGSYYSYVSGNYGIEKQRLEKICHCDVISSRNHYLRFDHRRTPRDLQNIGILVDTTLGFSDRDGFRNGSSFPFRMYDRAKNAALNLIEVPMVFMDTIMYEKKSNSGDVMNHLEAILARVKQIGGTVSVLFHYDILSISEIWFDIYQKFLQLAKNEEFDFITPSGLYKEYGNKS